MNQFINEIPAPWEGFGEGASIQSLNAGDANKNTHTYDVSCVGKSKKKKCAKVRRVVVH